ncbi:30S ribosomal protein S8 [Desulfobacterota bacterium AH_259_B03_O07]|nr:30S ribosomal protein S8 [Desulfobacterota bacterium AH_259_B03_O07]
MTDPISDMLTRIRNALIAKHKTVGIPASGIKVEVAKLLKEEGYISGYRVNEDGFIKTINLELKYSEEHDSIIREIKRISKPGRRVYVKKNEIPRIRGGLGITLLSTSKGIMTGSRARSLGIGGELICTVL